MRILIIIGTLFLTTYAQAEPWVCFDAATKRVNRVVEGDGLKLGIAGVNNSSIASNCILATAAEFSAAGQPLKKVDTSIASGSRVIDLTQAEIDAINQAAADAAEAADKTQAKAHFDQTQLKAFVKILIDEINILRSQHGLQPRTIQQLKTAIENEIDAQ